MAHGFPDYWSPEKMGIPVPSVGQLPWHDEGIQVIAPAGTFDIIDYTVGAGEVLFVTGGNVSCAEPGSQRYQFRWNTPLETSQWIYFDVFGKFPLNPSAFIEVLPGEHFVVRVSNQRPSAEAFYASAFGVRVIIVPGLPTPAGEGILIRQAGF